MYQFSIALENMNSCTYGIPNWEVQDGFFGSPLASITPQQREDARELLIRKLSRVVLYATDMPVADYAAYIRFFRNAHMLGILNVKLSAKAIAGASTEEISKIVAIGDSFSIGVLFELEAATIESFDFERYAAVRAENTGLVLNPMELLKAGIAPYNKILSKTRFAFDIRFLRVCDAVAESGVPVALGKGNCELKECTSKLLTRTYSGWFAFAPYGTEDSQEQIIGDFADMLCRM